MPLTFGQRKGLKPIKDTIQTNEMNLDLRTALWNTLLEQVWTEKAYQYSTGASLSVIHLIYGQIWRQVLHRALDEMPSNATVALREIRDYYFSCKWFEVYEFLECVLNFLPLTDFSNAINSTLAQGLSGYRFVGGVFSDITNAQEIGMLDEALADTDFPGVQAHLQRALQLLSDRKNPDFRNSIKESISAVESLVRSITGLPKSTLGDALKQAEVSGKIHPALKEAFLKLYGYTSDEQGIRHSMLDTPNLAASDARYFLLSCTSFINYLKAKLGKS